MQQESMDKKSKTPSSKQHQKEVKPKRQFKGEQIVNHDLFKLELANMKKNLSWTDYPRLEDVEHCHFFHTIDKKGKKGEFSSPTGNHFHKVEYKVDEEGNLIGECGPPLRKARKQYGVDGNGNPMYKYVNEPVNFGKGQSDTHTHDVRYVRSDTIEVKRMDAKDLMKLTELDRA